MEFAERTEHLAGHLGALLTLADAGRFPSSMALTRTALEHHVIDLLLLLADRYVEIVRPEDPADIDRWEEAWAAKSEQWTHDVVSVDRVRGGKALRLVRLGHKVVDDEGNERERISPYWVALGRYDAFIGHPQLQADVVRPFDALGDRVEWASRNQILYGAFLKWSSLCTNLQLSDLAPKGLLVQLHTHYTFLSAFTHATNSGYDGDRRGRPGSPTSVHLFGELALLYAIAIAIAQIETWSVYAGQRLHLLMPPRADILRAADQAREVIEYFWFLVGSPQPFDFYQEANRRAHPELLGGIRPSLTPDDLDGTEVGYYADPLDRLRRLHMGEREMTTGFGFSPLWETLHW